MMMKKIKLKGFTLIEILVVLMILGLLTAVIGMQSETGEFAEIVKKCVFQGKDLDDASKYHLLREWGDIIWYWSQGVMSLGYSPSQVIEENIKKLEKKIYTK